MNEAERKYTRPGAACTAAQKSSERHPDKVFYVLKRDEVLRYSVSTDQNAPGEKYQTYKGGLSVSI